MQATSAHGRPASPGALVRDVRRATHGALMKGSPARVLQDLAGEERVAMLLGKIEASHAVIEEQHAQLNALKQLMHSDLADDVGLQADELIYQHDSADDSGDETSRSHGPASLPHSQRRPHSAAPMKSVRPFSGIASPPARPLSAVPEYGGESRRDTTLQAYPFQALSASRRRPTSAGGIGSRRRL